MKSLIKILVTGLLLGGISLAQEASKENQPATKPVTSKPEASGHSTPSKKSAAKTTEDAPILTEQDKRGYALGVELGLDVAKHGGDINHHLVMQGMRDALAGKKFLMTAEDMNAHLLEMQKEPRERMAVARKELSEQNKKEGEAFLVANKTKEGVVSLPSGLQYKVLKSGDGSKPSLDDKVLCNYRGSLLDGTEIDSSYQRKEPSTLPLKGVIKGWTEALQLMPVGSKWEIFVPSELAYGERGDGRSIGPNATLVFEVELLSIQNKGEAQANPAGAESKTRGNM